MSYLNAASKTDDIGAKPPQGGRKKQQNEVYISVSEGLAEINLLLFAEILTKLALSND